MDYKKGLNSLAILVAWGIWKYRATVFLMALLQALQWCCELSLMSESFGARLEVFLVVLLLVFIFSLCSTSLLEC